jgi:hypothetical protein
LDREIIGMDEEREWDKKVWELGEKRKRDEIFQWS